MSSEQLSVNPYFNGIYVYISWRGVEKYLLFSNRKWILSMWERNSKVVAQNNIKNSETQRSIHVLTAYPCACVIETRCLWPSSVKRMAEVQKLMPLLSAKEDIRVMDAAKSSHLPCTLEIIPNTFLLCIEVYSATFDSRSKIFFRVWLYKRWKRCDKHIDVECSAFLRVE